MEMKTEILDIKSEEYTLVMAKPRNRLQCMGTLHLKSIKNLKEKMVMDGPEKMEHI